MQSKATLNGGSAFRIRRPISTSGGFTSDVDPTVREHLHDLNRLLSKRVFHPDPVYDVGAPGGDEGAPSKREAKVVVVDVRREPRLGPNKAILRRPLKPRHTDGSWPEGSLAHYLAAAKEENKHITLAEYIDRTPELSQLKYSAQESILSKLFALDYNVKAVLEKYSAISDYLIAFAYGAMDVEEIHGLKNFLVSNKAGAKTVATYAAVSAARTMIEREQLKVSDPDNDASPVIHLIAEDETRLSTADFKTRIRTLIADKNLNSKEEDLLKKASVGDFRPELKPLLIQYMKASPVTLTEANINFFLPQFILKATAARGVVEPVVVEADPDQDFTVEFLEDDQTLVQVSASAVKCAAQLYYGMVLGDELEVFEAMNYFTHKYLLRQSIEIQDSRLREDLQLYVFSNKFVDLKTGKITERTRPAERRMFYRQVFNWGGGQVTSDLNVNDDFQRLFKVLMLESANYLERARESFNPDGYVSKQNVMQAVEDIQYNLSTHCTGMSNVVTPLVYAELDFIIRRIFMHDQILRQVVPSGGTWWRVVETLYLALRNHRPKATVLYNKAKLGHEILRSIATYNPATFDNDQTFSAFISTVDAYITTQSILQAALTDDLKKTDEELAAEETPEEGAGATLAPAPSNGANGADAGAEWDF